jgi:hypothetical protein
MLKKLRLQLKLRSHLKKDIPIIILSAIGAAFSIIGPIHNYLISKLILLAILFVSIISIYQEIWSKLPWADFWLTGAKTRSWLKPRLAGNPSQLRAVDGVTTITVIGVSCTDIAYLFEEVIDSICSGISFRIAMMNPEHEDVGPRGIIKDLEPDAIVSKVVQAPLDNEIKKLAQKYSEDPSKDRLVSRLNAMRTKLREGNYCDHSTCIKVCEELWLLAGKEAKLRKSINSTIRIYYLNELPFARQWIIGDRHLLYSIYVGHPGVGVDNPMFYQKEGAEGKRAESYANKLIERLVLAEEDC